MRLIKLCWRCAEEMRDAYDLEEMPYMLEHGKCECCRSKTVLTTYNATLKKRETIECPQDCAECPY